LSRKCTKKIPCFKSRMQGLKAKLDVAGRFHNEDLAAGYDWVFLKDAKPLFIKGVRS